MEGKIRPLKGARAQRRFSVKARSPVVLGILGLGVAALLFRRGEDSVSMRPEDWRGPEEGPVHREYRSLGHAVHHWRELLNLGLLTVADIYLRHAISPAFRERIMILTAACNECPA
jgi:hypothetical protein